jgi:hypothetical protein
VGTIVFGLVVAAPVTPVILVVEVVDVDAAPDPVKVMEVKTFFSGAPRGFFFGESHNSVPKFLINNFASGSTNEKFSRTEFWSTWSSRKLFHSVYRDIKNEISVDFRKSVGEGRLYCG